MDILKDILNTRLQHKPKTYCQVFFTRQKLFISKTFSLFPAILCRIPHDKNEIESGARFSKSQKSTRGDDLLKKKVT